MVTMLVKQSQSILNQMKRNNSTILLLKLAIFLPMLLIALGFAQGTIFILSLLISLLGMAIRLAFKKRIEYTSTLMLWRYCIHLIDTIPLLIALIFATFVILNDYTRASDEFWIMVYSVVLLLFHIIQLRITRRTT